MVLYLGLKYTFVYLGVKCSHKCRLYFRTSITAPIRPEGALRTHESSHTSACSFSVFMSSSSLYHPLPLCNFKQTCFLSFCYSAVHSHWQFYGFHSKTLLVQFFKTAATWKKWADIWTRYSRWFTGNHKRTLGVLRYGIMWARWMT